MQIYNIGNSCGTVYHYTKLASAVKIITKEGIVFRAGRYDSMNDPQDSVFAASESLKRMGEEAYYVMDPNLYNISPYLVSFCRDNDLPLMWRLYDAEVTLHIDTEKIKKECEAKSKMIYMDEIDYKSNEDASKTALDIFAESSTRFCDIELEFAEKAKASFVKPIDFKCEKEWRIAYFDDYDSICDDSSPDKLCGDEIASEIKVDGTRYGHLSFYRYLKFPTDCLVGITIRAYNNEMFNLIRGQLRTWLASQGYNVKNIKIEKTKTQPVR